ncbi:MAG: hypothetical protein K6T80_00015 [Firmicutes bacterium]|nr:hypothetical protein [Bacillota bacterium]
MFQVNSISQTRTEFQKLFKQAVRHNREFLAENAKETTSDETVSIIRTKLLDEWLDRAYTFNPVWEYDEENKLWSVTLPEIRVYTDAPTKEDAAQQLVELALDYCEDYFNRLDLFTALPDRSLHYPYLRRVARCKDTAQVKEVLNL